MNHNLGDKEEFGRQKGIDISIDIPSDITTSRNRHVNVLLARKTVYTSWKQYTLDRSTCLLDSSFVSNNMNYPCGI